MNVETIINKLNLEPLKDEGGMYRATYTGKVGENGKPVGTAIYYLLTEESFSHLHRLPYDEIWHFYAGDKVELFELFPEGEHSTTVLGSNISDDEIPQKVVSAGVWMGARLSPGGTYALLGTTMAPGYLHEDYEHGNRDALVKLYPESADLIRKYTGKLIYK